MCSHCHTSLYRATMPPGIQPLCQFFGQLANLISNFDLEAVKEPNIILANLLKLTLFSTKSVHVNFFLNFLKSFIPIHIILVACSLKYYIYSLMYYYS